MEPLEIMNHTKFETRNGDNELTSSSDEEDGDRNAAYTDSIDEVNSGDGRGGHNAIL